MKAIFFIFIVICTWLVLPGFAISHKTYSPPSGFGCIYDGIGASADGTVYFGMGNHTNDAVMLRYDPDADRFDQLGRISAASQAAGNWKSGDTPGKIHTSVHEYNGKMYFASHSADEGDSIDYLNFRGGHLYSWDPATNTLADVNVTDVAIPNQGVMDIAIDKQRGLIYSIGYPNGHLWQHNLATGEDRLITATQQKLGSVSRYLMIGPQGRVFFIYGSGLYHYNPVDGTVHGRIDIPNRAGSGPHIQAALPTPSGDTIYFSIVGENRIYRLICSRDTVENVINEGTRAMAARWDLGRIYWVREMDNVQSSELRMHQIDSRQTTTVYSSMPSRADGCGGTDKNGDLIFGHWDNTAGYMVKVILDIPPIIVSNIRLREAAPDLSVSVRPNPFSGSAHILFSGGPGSFEFSIYNVSGRRVAHWPAHRAGSLTWRPSNTEAGPGVYFGRLIRGKNTLTTTIHYVK